VVSVQFRVFKVIVVVGRVGKNFEGAE